LGREPDPADRHGRSNWFFAGSLRAGKLAAAVMSLVHRLNGHDPYAYLKDLLERLPTLSGDRYILSQTSALLRAPYPQAPTARGRRVGRFGAIAAAPGRDRRLMPRMLCHLMSRATRLRLTVTPWSRKRVNFNSMSLQEATS
jgi:hypothetical protein